MRICFLIDGFLKDESVPINGTMVQAYNLAEDFADRNYEIYYVTATSSKKEITTTKENNITVYWIPYKNKYLPQLTNKKKYYEALKKINPDIIYNRGRNYLTYLAGKYAVKNSKKFIGRERRSLYAFHTRAAR